MTNNHAFAMDSIFFFLSDEIIKFFLFFFGSWIKQKSFFFHCPAGHHWNSSFDEFIIFVLCACVLFNNFYLVATSLSLEFSTQKKIFYFVKASWSNMIFLPLSHKNNKKKICSNNNKKNGNWSTKHQADLAEFFFQRIFL